ncbi:alpha/beta hydrolase [Staphylococcus roterodami]|nr:alpha/beta hydrolase [Staphylococcus roterodami]
MSISLNLTTSLLYLVKPKRYFAKSGYEFDKAMYNVTAKQAFKFPEKTFQNMYVEKISFQNHTSYIIRSTQKKQKNALIYFYGGGFIMSPQNSDFKAIQTIVRNLDVDVILPVLPLLPTESFNDICQVGLDIYNYTIKNYGSDSTQLLGFSSGASLCFYIFSYMQRKGLKLPYPNNIIACSPAESVPPTSDQIKHMDKVRKKDLIMDPLLMKGIARYMKNSKIPLRTLSFNMNGFPHTHITFGTHEIFYAYFPAFKSAKENYNLNFTFEVHEGMPHCWQLWHWTKEGRNGMKKIINTIEFYFDTKKI